MLEFPDEPDEYGRRVRVNFDLQDEFALHQPLSLWAVEALGALPAAEAEAAAESGGGDAIDHALNVLTIIESVQENPGVVLAAQVERGQGRADGGDEIVGGRVRGTHGTPRPGRLPQAEPGLDLRKLQRVPARHPWVGSDTVAPKAIVREMYERAMTFGEYVNDYGLKRSEGVLLRYLSDVYKGLVQNVPEDLATTELGDIVAWLGAVVRHVDSSLIDEWERLLHPEDADSVDDLRPSLPTGERTIVDDERAFRVMVRNRAFDWVQKLARRRGYDEIVADAEPELWPSGEALIEAMAPYWAEHDEILTDPGARSGVLFRYDRAIGRVTEILHDPDDTNEWRLEAVVDREASADEGRAVLRLVSLTSAR